MRESGFFEESERFDAGPTTSICIFAIKEIEKYQERAFELPPWVFEIFPIFNFLFPLKEKEVRIRYPYYFCVVRYNRDFNNEAINLFWVYTAGCPSIFHKYSLQDFYSPPFEEVLKYCPIDQ